MTTDVATILLIDTTDEGILPLVNVAKVVATASIGPGGEGLIIAKQTLDGTPGGNPGLYALTSTVPADGGYIATYMDAVTANWNVGIGAVGEVAVSNQADVDDPTAITEATAVHNAVCADSAGTHLAIARLASSVSATAPFEQALIGLSASDFLGGTISEFLVYVNRADAQFLLLGPGGQQILLAAAAAQLSLNDGTATATISPTQLGLFNTAPTGQAVAIPDASGGGTVDTEARAALNTLLTALRLYGLVAP